MYKMNFTIGNMPVFTLLILTVLGLSCCFPIPDLEKTNKTVDYFVPSIMLSRHKRSTNITSTSSDDGKSDIERFFDDPNNKAMYLVFPIFVLIIGTCCGLYFCDRAKRHFKKKNAQRRKQEAEQRAKEDARAQTPPTTSSQSVNTTHSDSASKKSENSEKPERNPEDVEMLNTNREDTPLEDVENCPEVKAVNAVPIKHRETTFMTDVRNANTYEVDISAHNEMSQRIVKSTNYIEKSKDETTKEKGPDTKSEKESIKGSKSDINANVVIKNGSSSRPSSRQSSKSGTNLDNITKQVKLEEKQQEPPKQKISGDTDKPVLPPYIPNITKENGDSDKKRSKRRSSMKSDSSGQMTNRSVTSDTKSSIPDVAKTEKYPKLDKKFTSLSPEAIGEILQYYKGKKHMPDIIPDESENLAPIKKRFRKAKYKIFNG